MSWLFSQALVAEYSEAICSDGDPYAPSSSTPTPRAYLSPDRMTDFSRLSRFGMTFAPLTDDRGAELLTWYLAGFPARTSVPQEKAQESTANDPASGWRWRESSVKYDPNSRLWRTRQCSLLEDSEWFSETWPRWGLMRDGECWELPMSARLTSESGYGSWPTPTACMSKGTSPASLTRKDGQSRANDRLDHAVLARMWPTPRATDGSNGGPNQRGSKGDLMLPSAVYQFPTPTATNTKANHMRGSDNGKEREARSYGATGQLNPTWVEWLMGWPLGWTDLKPSETDKFRNAPPKHGDFSHKRAACD